MCVLRRKRAQSYAHARSCVLAGVQVEAYRRDILREMRDKQVALQGSIADIVSQLEESQVRSRGMPHRVVLGYDVPRTHVITLATPAGSSVDLQQLHMTAIAIV